MAVAKRCAVSFRYNHNKNIYVSLNILYIIALPNSFLILSFYLFQNVEDDYLPTQSNEIKNGDKHSDGDDDNNGFANSMANEVIGKHSNDAHCCQQQKPIHTQNDEVYI